MNLSSENRWCIEATSNLATSHGFRGFVRVTRTIHRDLTPAEALALAAYLIAAANRARVISAQALGACVGGGYDRQGAALESDIAVRALVRAVTAAWDASE